MGTHDASTRMSNKDGSWLSIGRLSYLARSPVPSVIWARGQMAKSNSFVYIAVIRGWSC